MRILIINSEFPPIGGGAGNASANIARELAAWGEDVCVLTAAFGSLPRDEIVDGVRVVRVRALRRKADRSGALEQGLFIWAASFGLLRILPYWKPDVILAFFGVPAGVVALKAKVIFRIPYIVSLRGGDVPGFRPYDFGAYHRLTAPLIRLVWKNAAVVVANSQGLRALALNFERRFPIAIISNGVDLRRFTPVRHKPGVTRLLSVGRVVYQKGLDLGLRALAGLKDMPWEWAIAGDGLMLAELQELAQQLDIAGRIRFLGWQPAGALVERYRQSDLFLFPSRHEGMPNAVLEAMACGLPVIASRIAGNEELVVPGETGLLVETENVEQLRQVLRQLIPNHQARKSMGDKARRRVESLYGWDKVGAQYLEILSQAAEQR